MGFKIEISQKGIMLYEDGLILILNNIQLFLIMLESLEFAHFFEKNLQKKKTIKFIKMKKLLSKSWVIFNIMMNYLWEHEPYLIKIKYRVETIDLISEQEAKSVFLKRVIDINYYKKEIVIKILKKNSW